MKIKKMYLCLGAILILLIMTSCSYDNLMEAIDTNESDVNETNVTVHSNSPENKAITSLKDITDDMILNKEVPFKAIIYISNFTDNGYGFKVISRSFTGADYTKVIHADKKCKVKFKYKSTMKKDMYKIALILNGKKLVTLPEDKNEFIYKIPKGDTIVALLGYEAHGKLVFEMNKVKGVTIIEDEESDECD